MIAHLPVWPSQALPYATHLSSGAVTSEEILAKYVKYGSASALRSPEEERLDALERLALTWESRGSSPPTAEAIAAARQWLRPLREAANSAGLPWRAPHVSVSEEGEIAFEWWREDRKVTFYFSDRAPDFVKIWGPHIFDQMESGEILSSESFGPIWLWLHKV